MDRDNGITEIGWTFIIVGMFLCIAGLGHEPLWMAKTFGVIAIITGIVVTVGATLAKKP